MWLHHWKKLFIEGLLEDEVAFDWTARSIEKTQSHHQLSQATLISKSSGIWCGHDALRALEVLSLENGTPIEVKNYVKEGEPLTPKNKIASLHGPANGIVTFERTLINLVSYTSGIATQTRALVNRVERSNLKIKPRITPTRKTLPGYKTIAIQSALVGGAFPHRLNLSGGVLIKENHIAALGGIRPAIRSARQTAPHLLKIEIEVRNLPELQEALSEKAEVILLDNFSPEQIRQAIEIKTSDVLYEISGGIRLENLEDYLIEDVDVISVGALTHSVKSLDFSLLMDSLL